MSACALHPGSEAVQTCARCGGFTCTACLAKDGRHCLACAARLAARPFPPWLATLLGGGGPLGVYLGTTAVLNALRPDLLGPMFDHLFGFLLLGVTVVLAAAAAFITRLLLLISRRGLRIGLLVALHAFSVFGAAFTALFSPIVFAFMFGDVGR